MVNVEDIEMPNESNIGVVFELLQEGSDWKLDLSACGVRPCQSFIRAVFQERRTEI